MFIFSEISGLLLKRTNLGVFWARGVGGYPLHPPISRVEMGIMNAHYQGYVMMFNLRLLTGWGQKYIFFGSTFHLRVCGRGVPPELSPKWDKHQIRAFQEQTGNL